MTRKVITKSVLVSLIPVFIFSTFGCQGPAGNPGPTGAPASYLGGISGTVTDSSTGMALTGATVVTGSNQAATDASGAYAFSALPIGVYTLKASMNGYTPQQSAPIGVTAGGTATVNFPLSRVTAAVQPPVITWPSGYSMDALDVGLYNVGYNATVNFTANVTDPIYPASSLTYAWTVTPYPQYGGTETPVPGANTSSVTFTTDPMISSVNGNIAPDQGRDGIVAIGPNQTGLYRIELYVTNPAGGQAASAVMVRAASKTEGIGNVPVGAPVYLSFTETNPQILLGRPAGSSAVTSTVAASPYTIVTFTPDRFGQFTITETSSGNTLDVTAGNWAGSIDSNGGYSACMLCHNGSIAPDRFTPWAGTGHASMFTRGLSGLLGDGTLGPDGYEPIDAPPYDPAPINQTSNEVCLSCHTVGYDQAPLAVNNGFDDVMKTIGWTFPSALQPSDWTNMLGQYPTLAALANIQCESCHGPNDSPAHTSTPHSSGQTLTDAGIRIGWNAGVCSKCHDSDGPDWAVSPHANLELAISEAAVPNSPLPAHCGRCHAAQGFKAYLDQVSGTGNFGLLTLTGTTLADFGLTVPQVQPQTCQACHDPHDASNPHQLRVYGTTFTLPAGFTAPSVGAGALCMECHNTRNGEHDDTTAVTGYTSPHTPSQADILMGQNSYFTGVQKYPLTGYVSRHANISDTCVGCHMVLNPNNPGGAPTSHVWTINPQDKGAICQNCHGAGTTGDTLQGQVQGLLDQLNAALGQDIAAGVSNSSTTYDIWINNYTNANGTPVEIVPTGTWASNTITSAAYADVHGQQGYTLWINGIRYSSQLASITATTGAPPTGPVFWVNTAANPVTTTIIEAGWNLGLVEGDGSLGIHNPTYVLTILNDTINRLP